MTESPTLINTAGIQLRAAGKLSEAIDTFRRGVAAHPRVAALHQNLAQALYESGDLPHAIAQHRSVFAFDADNLASHLALYELLQISGDRVLALAHQRLALEQKRLFSTIAPREARSILALCAPGDWQANIPIDFIIDRETTTVHKLYLLDAGHLRGQPLPAHDVVWNTIAESPEAATYLRLADAVIAASKSPSLNAPRRVLETSRMHLPHTLAGTGAHVPLVDTVPAERLKAGSVPFAFPIIARPLGSHAGHGLERLESAEACGPYVENVPSAQYVVSPFVDYASGDGYFRKYRIMFVDGKAFATHLAVSPNWMIHYYNAPMKEHAWMRDEEATFLKDVFAVFDGPRAETLAAIAASIRLEYFGIDCGIDSDGRVLVFEADPAMLVHTSDPIDLYPYKKEYVPRIFRAVEHMIDRRKTTISI
jgi:tetratricopeptide (TPR) repeat protein